MPGSYWVEPRLLAGPYPRDLDALLIAGVDLFVDLTEESEGLPRYWNELEHRRFPIADFTAPSAEILDAVLAFLAQQLAAGRTVYLHCRGGRGRTGCVVGCYFADRGLDALALLPHPLETDEQLDLVRRRSG